MFKNVPICTGVAVAIALIAAIAATVSTFFTVAQRTTAWRKGESSWRC